MDSMEVELYWRPGCPFCMALRPRLHRSGLPVREVNIWEDAEAAARVREVADGNETVPTVFVGSRALVNPGMGAITDAVRAEAPELMSRGTARKSWRRWFSRGR